jgi:putative NADH-flavin reductase
MKIAIFGATGALGRECLAQCLEAGHDVSVLVRSAEKLAREIPTVNDARFRDRLRVIEGDGLNGEDVRTLLGDGIQGILFCVGVVKNSPEDLCTTITGHILDAMPTLGVRRFVWCGGGSNLVEDDQITLGAKFVAFFARNFMGIKHRDKNHQLALLARHHDVEWIGIRPLQMLAGPRRGNYRVGFDRFSGMSKIHFADCADAMIHMLDEDRWLHKAPCPMNPRRLVARRL